MSSGVDSEEPSGRSAVGIAAASAGMIVFAICAHQGLPWIAIGAGGLWVTATAMGWARFGATGPAAVLGLGTFSVRSALVSLAGLALGAALGLWHRSSLGLPLQSSAAVEPFVVWACLIGATEEFVYRGWVLGRAETFGWPAAVTIAAVAHAAYKTALFAWPAVPAPFDLAAIALLTFSGGIVFGLLRVVSGSLVPAILAHGAFDFVVYRSVAHAPWWVWG